MKITPVAQGVDKIVCKGILKEKLTILDDDSRATLKYVKDTNGNVIAKKVVTREQRKIREGYTVPFYSVLMNLKQSGYIKHSFKEYMRFGQSEFELKYVLKEDHGQLYSPYSRNIFSTLPGRYEFNPNKALRNIKAFLPFCNELISTMENIEIPEMHLNFDFEVDFSQYRIFCVNRHRKYNNEYENTTYYGFQQHSPICHAYYDKIVELLDKGKSTDHLPDNYYRYELRLQDKSTVYRFLTDKIFRKELLSEMIFIKEIPTVEEIQAATRCTKYRATQTLAVINENEHLFSLDSRAKKIVAKILQQLSEIELSVDIENLTPYFNMCKGEILEEADLPNTLVGETMVYEEKEKVTQISTAETEIVEEKQLICTDCLSGEKMMYLPKEIELNLTGITSLSRELLTYSFISNRQITSRASPLGGENLIHFLVRVGRYIVKGTLNILYKNPP